MYETEAIVLRAIRYSEADNVLALLTEDRGRVSAIVKGARKATSRLGGRLQPGVRAHLGLHEGRGDMATVRQAQVVEPYAGLWVEGYRLRAAGCLLESALRVLHEGEASPGAYNLLANALAALASATAREGPPRLDPLVLSCQCKLLVVAGLFPRLASCASCEGGPPLVAFSAAAGGALCPDCAGQGETVDAAVFAALAALVGSPLAQAEEGCPPAAAPGVERMVGLVLREHLGVTLRSAAPL